MLICKSASKADLIVVAGCPVACGKTAAVHVGVSEFRYFDISVLLPDAVKGKKYDQVQAES